MFLVVKMKLYIDLLLFLNFAFDFILLLTTNILLKRQAKIFNITLGAFIGSLSTLVLFFNINSLQLFLIKIYLSIIMCLITFSFKDIKYMIINIFLKIVKAKYLQRTLSTLSFVLFTEVAKR